MTRKKSAVPSDPPPPSPPALLDDAPTHSLADTVQANLLAAVQGIQALAARQATEGQPDWAKQLKAVQIALRFVHKQHPNEVLAGEEAADAAQLQAFAETVQQARKAAGWRQADLAKRAGLSLGTIKHVEQAQHQPTQTTLLRLLAVKELGLAARSIPWPKPAGADTGAAPNCWIAPGYDAIEMFTDLLELLNGRGGSLEQTYCYLDHKSALNYYRLTNQSSYVTEFRVHIPLDPMARRILEHTGRAGLDVIALGAGDSKEEVRLTRHLLDRMEQPAHRQPQDLRLYLLDISQPLLNVGYKHAADTVGHRPGVFVCAVQGNFHHLPRYTQLHYAPERSHRRRIITMLGGTLCNLEDEHRFFRHSLVGFAPDDLLLVQLQLAHASADSPDDIRRRDPAIKSGLPTSYAEWLAGPLWRYCDGITDVRFDLDIDVRCPVDGSYSLDAVASVSLQGRRERRFSMFRFKRYDSKRFARWLRPLGWELVAETPFGIEPTAPAHSLLLFRRLPEHS